MIETHKELMHRGKEAIYYKIKNLFYWPKMKEFTGEVVKNCETCQINNRKTRGGSVFVETNRKLEKVSIDILTLENYGKYVLVAIDYFTRRIATKILTTREVSGILKFLNELKRKGIKPEELITDNAKEFCSEEFRKWCEENGIKHRRTSVESHCSNGRVERALRTIRESLSKIKGGKIESNIGKITSIYNNTFHSAINCTPMEVWNEVIDEVALENSRLGRYAKRMKKGFREKFKENQQVRIAKRENLGRQTKNLKG